MFDILLKTKFYSKCKSDIKLTRTRLDMIIKKRNAMHKFLRNDIAHLLKNGLHTNAYSRAEGLVVEMNKSSSYEFIEQCSVCVSTNLSAMDKQKECPEECREAVSSLMFGAARFADLPELRDLRSIFSDRYGNSVDCYVNKQFVEMFKSDLPSKDSKLQLLQDIALESELKWNSKALENKKETIDDDNNMNAYDFKYPREVLVSLKDIQVRRNEKKLNNKKEEIENEYKSIPPPYTKLEVNNKAKSVRRKRQSKENIIGSSSSSSTESSSNEEDINKEKEALAQKILKFFDKTKNPPQEEEKMIDRLLRYYGRKNDKSQVNDSSNLRSVSLPSPNENENENENETPPKTHNRASSFQPGILNGNHVHPKLPDYDDFVAQLAASRRN